MKIVLGNSTFHSKANAKETLKNLIYNIGVTNDVNNQLLYDLIKKYMTMKIKQKFGKSRHRGMRSWSLTCNT